MARGADTETAGTDNDDGAMTVTTVPTAAMTETMAMTKDESAGGPITGAWRDEEERRAIGVGDGQGGWGSGVIRWTRFDFMMEV